MSYFVAIQCRDGMYRHFDVPEEVYIYIRQLECRIEIPYKSELVGECPTEFMLDVGVRHDPGE
jgi:hypothetical protein